MSAERVRRLLPPLVMALLAGALPGLLRGEDYARFAAAGALVERRTPALDGHIAAIRPTLDNGWEGLAYVNGHYYLAQSPLVTWLTAPWHAAGSLVAALQPGAGWAPLVASLIVPALAGLLLLGVARLTARRHLGIGATVVVMLLAAAFVPLAGVTTGGTAWLIAAAAFVWLSLPEPAPRRGGALVRGTLAGLAALAQPWLVPAALVATLAPGRARLPWRLAGLLAPLALGLVWQTVVFGRPWRFVEQFALTPSPVGPPTLAQTALLVVALVGVVAALWAGDWRQRLIVGLALAGAVVAPGALDGRLLFMAALGLAGWSWLVAPARAWSRWSLLLAGTTAVITWCLTLPGLLAVVSAPVIVAYAPAQRLVAAVAMLCLGALLAVRARARRPAAALVTTAVLCLLIGGARGVSATGASAPSLVPPVVVVAPTGAQPLTLWRLADGAATRDERLLLPAGGEASAESPLVTARAGDRFCAEATPAPGALMLRWEDDGQRVLAAHGAPETRGPVCFAAPPGATGVRLRLQAGPQPLEIGSARLWSDTPRLLPLPDGARAALAFTFDWESAMGGLIHSRGGAAAYEGDRAAPDREASAEAVDVARQRGLRMREGVAILADLFRPHGVRGSFYATGYNLLRGNIERRTFAGDPTYRWASRKNGWGSDYWTDHRWYGDDPYGTEASDPAWYFGSLTLRLASEGHEIQSHTFGHLYVRGATPDELESDQREWNGVAADLGLGPARSFAFPWTSSNSVRAPHYERLWRAGITSVTRMYELRPGARFELDEVAGMPGLLIYPDHKVDSTPEGERQARLLIDELLARGGYQSLWTHPEEVVDPEQVAVWRAVVDYAAEARARGLWIAPLTEIVERVRATRAVEVVPVADGAVTRLVVTSKAGAALDGLTVDLPDGSSPIARAGQTATGRGQVVLSALEPAVSVELVIARGPDGAP